MTHCNTVLLIFYLRGGGTVSCLVIISQVLQIYILGFPIEHKFLKGRDLPWMPPVPPGTEDAADVVSFVLNDWRNCTRKKDGSAVQRAQCLLPIHSHALLPLLPLWSLVLKQVSTQSEIHLDSLKSLTWLRCQQVQKWFFMKPLLLCFSGSRDPTVILLCASYRCCYSKNEGHNHLVPAPGLCLLLHITPLPSLTATP